MGRELIERGIPDRTDTSDLPAPVAAEIDFLAGRFEPWFDRGSDALRARALAAAGASDDALDLLAGTGFASLDTQDLVAASWAVSRCGTPAYAAGLLERLMSEPERLTVGDLPLGPRSLTEGLLHAAVGDLDRAAASLADAVDTGDRQGPFWGAIARAELGRILLCARAVDPQAPGVIDPGASLRAAALFFRSGGHRSLAARVGELLDPPVDARAGGPTVGRFVCGPSGSWRVGFGVMGDIEFDDAKGLRALHHLVATFGRPCPAVLLDAVASQRATESVEPLGLRVRLAADIDGVTSTGEFPAEDAMRSRVSKLVTRTIGKLTADHPLLGAHLRAHVRVGSSCVYEPPVEPRVVWRTTA